VCPVDASEPLPLPAGIDPAELERLSASLGHANALRLLAWQPSRRQCEAVEAALRLAPTLNSDNPLRNGGS
jgi:hypothetical protein